MRKYVGPMKPDTYYHVYNRACGSEKLFRDDQNYYFFMDLIEERLSEYVELYGYCLIPNHFHLLIRTKSETEGISSEVNLSKKFGNFFAAYAQSFNNFYHRNGNLFAQNFRRKPVENENYLKTAIIYIHRNPIKHGLVSNLSEWNHSSYLEYTIPSLRYCRNNIVIDWFNSFEIFKFCHSLDSDSDIE